MVRLREGIQPVGSGVFGIKNKRGCALQFLCTASFYLGSIPMR